MRTARDSSRPWGGLHNPPDLGTTPRTRYPPRPRHPQEQAPPQDQTPPLCEENSWHTLAKILPYTKLRLRAVKRIPFLAIQIKIDLCGKERDLFV